MSRVHSYSGLTTFLQCPYKWHAQYVERKYRDSSPALAEGNRVHSAIESYLKKNGPLPDRRPPDGLVEKLQALGVEAERPLALTRNLTTTDFWADNAWLRGKMDVVYAGDGFVWGFDWKTGKVRENSLQAKVYGTLLAPAFPGYKITIYFDYLEKGRAAGYEWQESDTKEVVRLLEEVDNATEFPPRPGPLCRWCSVEDCRYYVRREG